MAYAIMRCEKVKSGGRAAVIHAHNTRTSNPANADPAGLVKPIVQCADLPAAIDARIESAGATAKRRANSVIAQEMILTASPEYFRPNDPARAGHWEKTKMQDWANASSKWLKSEFGDRLISAHLHLDEATPHIHAVMVPITPDNRLSAREVFSPITLRRMQDSYAQAVAHLGLQRGIEGSVATHEEVRQYYGRVKGPTPAPPIIPPPPAMVSGNTRREWAEDQTQAVAEAIKPIQAQAREMQRARDQADQAKTSAERACDQAEDWKRETARVRDLPLQDVLDLAGLSRDPADRKQWKGEGMRITVEGSKWYDHEDQNGGGGAIDLAMHCTGASFKNAVAWLGGRFEPSLVEAAAAHRAAEAARAAASAALAEGSKAGPPEPSEQTWPQVRQYLTETRALAPELVDWCHKRKMVYSDSRSNAVFVYGGPEQPTQVELRGTGKKPFHGFRGRKEDVFHLPPAEKAPPTIAIVESAIDALSYRQLHPGHCVAAVGGGGSRVTLHDIAKLAKEQGMTLVAAYDADKAGDGHAKVLSEQAQAAGVTVTRKAPINGKDWNEALKAHQAAQAAPEALAARQSLEGVRQHLAGRKAARKSRSDDEELGRGPSR